MLYFLTVIGEVSRRLTDATRTSLPDVPWRHIIGMRNFVVHEYDRVVLARIWETVVRDIPELIARLESLVPPDLP